MTGTAVSQQGVTGPDSMNPSPMNEEWTYTLTVGGRPVGAERFISIFEGERLVLRRESTFVGPLAPLGPRRVQQSVLDLRTGSSLAFAEGSDFSRWTFETRCDPSTGLLTLRQGRDTASVPLVRDHLDPLSVIWQLRALSDEVTQTRFHLVGGDVLVSRVPDASLEMPWGKVRTRVYYLRPGRALVYIDVESLRVQRFIQQIPGQIIESRLVQYGVPDLQELMGRMRPARGGRGRGNPARTAQEKTSGRPPVARGEKPTVSGEGAGSSPSGGRRRRGRGPRPRPNKA